LSGEESLPIKVGTEVLQEWVPRRRTGWNGTEQEIRKILNGREDLIPSFELGP